MNNSLKYIYNKSELNAVLDFLRTGFNSDTRFNWSKKRSNKIKDHFIESSDNVPIAAYQKIGPNIKIAILIFDQTRYLNKNKNIISFSSWYAVPEFRGLPAINFARLLIRDLDNFIITNYTPSLKTYSVFKSLGFDDMEVQHIELGVSKKFPFLKFYNIQNNLNYDFFRSTTFKHVASIKKNETNKNCEVHYRLRKIRIKNYFLKLKIGDLYVDNEEKNKISFWSLVIFALKNCCLQLNIFIKSNQKSKKYNWLIKNSNDKDLYISPAGSELCIEDK